MKRLCFALFIYFKFYASFLGTVPPKVAYMGQNGQDKRIHYATESNLKHNKDKTSTLGHTY